MALDRVAQPFYDSSVSEYHNKNYRQVLFTSGRAVQCRELTGIGNYATEHIKEVAGLMYKDGTILNGCNVRSIDRTERTDVEDALSGLTVGRITMNGGRIFADGYPFEIEFSKFPNYCKDTVPIRLTGSETIYVEILDTVVTAVEDETLLDPASGYDNYQAPGAHRLQRVARYISTAHKDYQTPGNVRIPVVELYDGKIIYEAASAGSSNVSSDNAGDQTNILDLMSQRTFETSGNYLVNGFRVKQEISPDNTKVGVTVSPGVAYISGYRVELQSSFTGYIDKVMVTSTVQGEEKPVEYELDGNGDPVLDENGSKKIVRRYRLGMSPVASVNSVAVPRYGIRQLMYNEATGTTLQEAAGSINKILLCFRPTDAGYTADTTHPERVPAQANRIDYKEGTDFRYQNNQIIWIPEGDNPSKSGGQLFYVLYLYKPNLEATNYTVEYASDREATLTLPVKNGMVTIPAEFYNPTVKSVVATRNGESETLVDNKQYYVAGNTIYVATATNPNIPIRVVRRTNGTLYDNIGMGGAVLKTAKLYSEQGIVFYRMEGLAEANPNFRFYPETGNIEWYASAQKPSPGEAYLCEVTVPTGVAVDFGDATESVVVNFTYENLSSIYTNTCHDSYLIISDDITLGRSDLGGDNITVSYEIAKARTTTVGLNASGQIEFYHGTVIDNNNNLTPIVPASSLPIADLFIKPTTSDQYIITSANNYRLRQTDLRNMFDRLKDVEYNIALDALETDAETKLAGSVLRGVFTDSFTSVKKADNSLIWSFINSTDNQAIPLITQGMLSPNFRRGVVDLSINADNTTAGLFDDVYMLTKNYSTEVWLRQPYGTKIRSAAEGLDLMECFPEFSIDPDNDQFIQYEDQNVLYEADNSNTKNCYVFNGDAASLISAGSLPLPANHTGVDNDGFATVQFWMYLDTEKDCMPFSFQGVNDMGLDIWSTQKYFGFNTYCSDVNGILNEELRGYWRAITVIFNQKGTSIKNYEIYINGEKQNVNAYATNTTGKYAVQNALFGDKIRIGGSFRSSTSWFFKGKIADIRLWNRKCTLQEIKDFNSKDLTGYEDGLIGWWKDAIKDGQVANSCKTAAAGTHLVYTRNGGYPANDTKLGTITCETRSFAKMIAGSDASETRGAVIKNVMDLTVGSVPANTTELVIDPTVAAKNGTGQYATNNAAIAANIEAAGGMAAGAYTAARDADAVGSVKYQYSTYLHSDSTSGGSKDFTSSNQYEAYNTVETYYEKVTTQTDQILGDFVTDVASVSTLRQRVIHVQGSGFLADTDLISITFDGIPVQLRKTTGWTAAKHGTPSTATKDSDRYWKTNNKGEFACEFTIPEGVLIGVREVRLTAPGGIELKKSYWGAGLKAGKLTLTQSNETVTWEPRTQVISQQYMNSDGWILLDGWNCRSRCGTTPLCQTFYVNDSSLTKPVIKTIATNSDVFLESVDVFFRTPGDCIDCIAGFVELTDSGVPRSDSGAGPSRFVGGVKVFDSKTINVTDGDPSLGTAAHNIKWENLVPLKGGKGYGFIVGSTDGNTTMWVASIENNEVNTDIATGTKVIQEPDRGILLSSPNGQTWATYIMEDMKYTFHVANFFNDNRLSVAPASMRPSQGFNTTGKVSYIEYDPVDIAAETGDSLSAMNFFMFEVNAQNSNDGSGFVQYEYSVKDEGTGTFGSWQPFEAGMMVYLSNAIKTIKIRVALYSYNPYSTPIVSKYACLTCGQYQLPAIYTSITGTIGTWNNAEIYMDKFFDENKSTISLFISPDQGYTWKEMTKVVDLTPITASSTRYNGEAINQYHYRLKLEVEKPVIESVDITPNADPDSNWTPGQYEAAIALVDAQGNESPLSDSYFFQITNASDSPVMKVKFDPNATGYRLYGRLTTQDSLMLYYDSTAVATLAEDLNATEGNATFKLSEGAAMFPATGSLLIDNEYMTYTLNTSATNNSAGEKEFTVTATRSSLAHHGRENIVGAHKKGTQVMMINDGFLHQDSPTPCVSGIWRFPSYDIDSSFNWYLSVQFKDQLAGTRSTYFSDVGPRYNEDVPANYTSENVTFRIEMKDREDARTVPTLDRIPMAGRIMVTAGYEAY